MRLSLFIVLISFLCIRSLHLLQPTRAHTEPQRPILARQIQQLDVGQGDAALIQQQTGEWGLLDTGDSHAIKDLDWIELFAHRGITQLAWIAFTHLDSDHTGALFRLARLIPIGCVTTSQAEWETPRGQRMRQRLTQLRIPALDWSSHCMPFPVLDPPPTQNLKDGNARMSAILVPTPHGYYLNAGDSDLHQEHRVLQWISKTTHVNQPCLILKISHHGSRFATSQDWLSILQPKQAWISSGAGNTYGHPHPRVLQILHSLHIPTHRTDQEGVLQTP